MCNRTHRSLGIPSVAMLIPLAVSLSACGSTGSRLAAAQTPPPAAGGTPRISITPQAASAGNAYKVGQRLEASGMALTVVQVYSLDKIDDLWTPKAGNVFLIVEVDVENVSKDRGFFNPLDFQLRDAEGNTYLTTITAPDPSLKSGELLRSEKAHGNVAFEVPAVAKGFVLLWQPNFLERPARVDLGR